MKSTIAAHRAQPWRVHTLAADFEPIDVWRVAGEPGLERFLAAFWTGMGEAEHWALSRLRVAIGRVMGWDDKAGSLPIPGCVETSLRDRLTAEDRAQNQLKEGAPSPLPVAGVRAIYRFEHEALFEVSNDTVHALIHLGEVEGGGELAVYIKSRGAMTRVYMAAIKPFRHLYIYPKLLNRVTELWAQHK